MKVERGIIVSLVMSKGFGFIRQDDGTDLFFHATGVCQPTFQELREGQPVEYMVIPSKHHEGEFKAIGVVVA